MLPTTLALYLATQLSLASHKAATPAALEKNCSGQEVREADGQNCRPPAPTRQECWAAGRQLNPETRSCVPLTLATYCREHDWDYEQEHTVSRILNDLNAHDCEEAERILRKSRRLTLHSSGVLKVQDLRPLRALPFLEEIRLDGHRVSDLRPLQKIPGLKKLALRNNEVYDLEPLLSLPHLEELNLAGNPILPNDPVLKKIQKRVKVILQEEAAEAPARGGLDSAGFTVDPD